MLVVIALLSVIPGAPLQRPAGQTEGNSPLMDSLRAQETELLRKVADMRSVYGQNHPQMINAHAELQSVRDKMLDEARRIIGDFENEVSVATAREKELQNNMTRLQDEAGRVDLAGAELSALQGEVNTNRQLFETFLVRFREIVEQQGLQESDAKILSPANPPNNPSYPQVWLLTLIAFGASLVVALNTDASVRRLGKGGSRPINALEDRAAVIAALASVDLVTWFDQDTPLALIVALRPDVLVKGGDWTPDRIVGAPEVIARGGRVHSIAFRHDRSTSALIERIRSG